jgi:hypothetical protein
MINEELLEAYKQLDLIINEMDLVNKNIIAVDTKDKNLMISKLKACLVNINKVNVNTEVIFLHKKLHDALRDEDFLTCEKIKLKLEKINS